MRASVYVIPVELVILPYKNVTEFGVKN